MQKPAQLLALPIMERDYQQRSFHIEKCSSGVSCPKLTIIFGNFMEQVFFAGLTLFSETSWNIFLCQFEVRTCHKVTKDEPRVPVLPAQFLHTQNMLFVSKDTKPVSKPFPLIQNLAKHFAPIKPYAGRAMPGRHPTFSHITTTKRGFMSRDWHWITSCHFIVTVIM